MIVEINLKEVRAAKIIKNAQEEAQPVIKVHTVPEIGIIIILNKKRKKKKKKKKRTRAKKKIISTRQSTKNSITQKKWSPRNVIWEGV